MSKAQIIRKKALDLVRDQDWPGAIREYKRLVELDQSNPNLHNELADLYLKTSQKNEAYDAFVRAIDEYVRVGLFNNAVAVCKKVLRVLPARHEVYAKLGVIRGRQGLTKEAESYYISFLEKAASGAFAAESFKDLAKPIIEDVGDSPALLERFSQAFVGYSLMDEAGDVLVRLVAIYDRNNDSAGSERVRAEIEKIGMSVKLAEVKAAATPQAENGTVITEDNLWTKSHTEGERIVKDPSSSSMPTGSPAAPAPQPAGAAPGGPSARDLYLLRLARGSAEARPKPSPVAETTTATETIAVPPAPQTTPVVEEEEAPATMELPGTEPVVAESPQAPVPAPAPADSGRPGANGSGLQVSALLDGDADVSAGETDFRSHYDLGMAYIEMDLYTEAIREYQVAAKSPQYQVKCLEMIGLCFIKQNQPQLAIRQLSKGLSLIGSDSEESLGIKYNLGLAHEMTGDLSTARTYFEDVYVVDVTFRDVSEKVRRLAETS